MKIVFKFFTTTILILPSLVFAAPADFKQLIGIFIDYVQLVIPIVFGLAVLFFFWGIVKFIFAAGNEERRKEGKNVMTWGLLAMFVLLSILGIISIVGSAIFPNFKTYIPRSPPGYYTLPEGANVGE